MNSRVEFPNTLDLKPYTIQEIMRREKERSDSAKKSAERSSPEAPGAQTEEEKAAARDEKDEKEDEKMLDETPEDRERRLYEEEILNY